MGKKKQLGEKIELDSVSLKIKDYVKAGYPGIILISYEEARVNSQMKQLALDLHHDLQSWSVVGGYTNAITGNKMDADGPIEAIGKIPSMTDGTIVMLQDFHMFLEEPNPTLYRLIKEVLAVIKTRGITIVMLGCRQVLPAELEKEFVVVDYDLPERPQLEIILKNIADSVGKDINKNPECTDKVLEAAMGMTCQEAENAFALSVVEKDDFDPILIGEEKAQVVKKNGILEIVKSVNSLDDIGGLDLLKTWLVQRRDSFSEKARSFGLPTPKGIMIVGVPGTGKSLTAKAVSTVLKRILLRLDAGRIFASLVGESERNVRAVIKICEALAPCVLWIDEIEKAFSGTKSSNSTDGGTSSRVFGSFITWLQEKSKPVFVVATANDVTQLPPELMRAGRFDSIWSVDLPNIHERREIWNIQINKYKRKPESFDLETLAEMTEEFSGAEIEQVVVDSLYSAFADGKDLLDEHLTASVGRTVPLARTMTEQVQAIRKWGNGRAKPASSAIQGSTGKTRKLTL